MVSCEKSVCPVQISLPALATTFEDIYDVTGDAEAHGVATLLIYNTILLSLSTCSEMYYIL